MPRPSPYTVKQKSSILDSVKSSRKSGKKWPEILKAAGAEGFKGGLPYLMKLAWKAGSIRGRRHVAPVAMLPKRGPGRPKGTAKRRGRPPMASAASTNGYAPIERMIAQIARERISGAIDRAFAVLAAAK